eukprot:COSAG02_NODE_1406_length_12786_cov_5.493418_6_plen_82_part_00
MAARVTSAHATLAACPGTGGSWHELETRRTRGCVDRLYTVCASICAYAHRACARPRARSRARSLPRSGENMHVPRLKRVNH